MRWRMQGQQQITIRFEIYKRDNVYRRVQKNGDPTTCYGYAQCGIVFRKVIFCKRHGTVSQISIFDRFPIKTLELSTKKTKTIASWIAFFSLQMTTEHLYLSDEKHSEKESKETQEVLLMIARIHGHFN